MKKLYILLFLTLFAFSAKAVNYADFIFLNNNSSAASLDLEVRVKGVDTVFARVNGVNYLHATAMFKVPSSVLLKLTYFNAGTTTPFYTADNVVLDDNSVRLAHLFGTSTSKRYTMGTAYKSTTSGTIVYDFKHSTSTLGEIDLIVRGGNTLANDFVYGTGTFTFDNSITAANVILDVTPFNSATPLFAYNLNGAALSGKYIYLFTAGTGSNLTMYMLEMDGTVTQLTLNTTAGIFDSKLMAITVYPNPVSDMLFIENSSTGDYTLEVKDLIGKHVASVSSHGNGESISLNVSALPEGLFICTLKNGDKTYTGKIQIKH